MPRPKSKTELEKLAAVNFKKLFEFINQLSTKQQSEDFKSPSLNRNIRDILYHLHKWHMMALEWNTASKENTKPEMPAPGFSWKSTPDLNIKIQKEGENFTLEQAQQLLESSHQEILQTISEYPENILFEKKIYKWTGSTSVGSYFVSASSSHYDWALKFLKKQFA